MFSLYMSVKQKLIKRLIKKSHQIPCPRCKNIFLMWCVHKTKRPVHTQIHPFSAERGTSDVRLFLVLCLPYMGSVCILGLFPPLLAEQGLHTAE